MSLPYVNIIGHVKPLFPGMPLSIGMNAVEYSVMAVTEIGEDTDGHCDGGLRFELDNIPCVAREFVPKTGMGRPTMDKALKLVAIARRSPVIMVADGIGQLTSPLSQRGKKKFQKENEDQ